MPPDPPAQVVFGHAVRRLRCKRDLSQEDLAHEAGVHRTYMGSVERGERNLSLTNLLRIASALGISGSELLAEANL